MLLLIKNCRLVLKKLRNQKRQGLYRSYSIPEIAEICSLTKDEAIAVCRQLEKLDYVEITWVNIYEGPIIRSVKLTGAGAHYDEKQQADIFHYIAHNWISFFALIVAAVALIRTF